MRVRITRDTVANGAPVFVGEVHDLPGEDAALLFRLGKAEAVGDEAPVDAIVPVVDAKPARKRTR